MPRRYNRGALIAQAIMEGVGGFAKSASEMRQKAAERELKQLQMGEEAARAEKTAEQRNWEYEQKLPPEQQLGFRQSRKPWAPGYTGIEGGIGFMPKPKPQSAGGGKDDKKAAMLKMLAEDNTD